MNIENRVAIITGGGSGLGAETARQLAKAGAKIALLDKNVSATEKIAKEIGGLVVGCDVADSGSAEKAVEQITETMGAPRICINCAGVAPVNRIVGKSGPMPLKEFVDTIQINLIGTFNMMRLVAAKLIPSESINEDGERGIIINTASIAAFEGQIGQTGHSRSKSDVALRAPSVMLSAPACKSWAASVRG